MNARHNPVQTLFQGLVRVADADTPAVARGHSSPGPWHQGGPPRGSDSALKHEPKWELNQVVKVGKGILGR